MLQNQDNNFAYDLNYFQRLGATAFFILTEENLH